MRNFTWIRGDTLLGKHEASRYTRRVRLTTLTLHGFKSFGDRTTIEFAPGVTAIIGPNGSGKSNVIEALRWTSGGGRASEFRAGDKADLIFHGAAGKRALGYAEVELEIKGASQHVHIARSLYRDGQSKLKLNGKNARFLDVEDELSGSGLGRGGLALIGQGEVSQVLMADPPKLLDYVAEAAGVAKLNTRREQTHTRLQTTREHLARLDDILQELRRQIEQLEREARQAERAGALERETLQLRFTLSRRRVESVQQEVESLTQERTLLENAVREGRVVLDAAREAWNRSRQRLSEQEVQYRQAMALTEARRGDLRVAQERLSNLQDRLERTRQENSTLRHEITRLENAAPPAAPEGDAAYLQAGVDQAHALLTASQQALATREQQLSAINKQLEQARQEHMKHMQAIAAAESRQAQLQEQLTDIDARLTNTPSVDESTQETLERDIRQKTEHVKALQASLEEHRAKLEALQRQHARAHAEAQALERAAERSRRAFEARQGYAQGPKMALTSGISGVLGSVADLLRVPSAYELALSSALGRRVENVVVDSSETAQQVLRHLKRTGGWVTLLPLDLIDGRSATLPAHLANEQGIIGLCIDLIEVELRYAPLMRQLLGNTVVVESMDDAVRIAKRHTQRPRMVTRDGDLLESFGAISGGRRQVNTGMLGAAKEVEDAERAAQEASRVAEAHHHSLIRAQQAFKETQEVLAHTAKEQQAQEQALAQVRERNAANRTVRSELLTRKATLQETLAALVLPEVPHDAPDTQALQEQAAHLAEGLQVLRAQQAEHGRRRAEAQQTLAIHQEKIQAFHANKQRFEEEQARLQQLVARAEQLTRADLELRETVQQAEKARDQAQAALPADLNIHEAAYTAAKRATDEAERKLSILTQELAERGAKLEEVNLTLARRETALEGALEEYRAFPDGLAPIDGSLKMLRERLADAERELQQTGPVNHRAKQEHAQQSERLTELETQMHETLQAVDTLEQALHAIDTETTTRLNHALIRLRSEFTEHVKTLFGPGAVSDIDVTYDEGRPTGLKISLQPPGKQTRSLNLLSVGERTMGAMAFLFSLMSGSSQDATADTGQPQRLPIAILDEVDAPLDEANIRRFRDFLQKLSTQGTQFILITHQKATMEIADVLWGVTTERGVSRVFSISKAEHVTVG